MKIAIFGVEGQLGRDLQAALSDRDVVEMLYADVDITDAGAVRRAVSASRPDWVVNCAALTNVDRCETERDEAYAVNATGAGNVGSAAAEAGAKLVHVSTDYVFDGEKKSPYRESDPTGPLNVYGASKLAGESLAGDACPEHYIVRTSGLYGRHECWGKGTNFVRTMLRLARDHTRLKIVRDEVLTPTFTEDLSAHIRSIIDTRPDFGIYHATNDGACSWFDFATEIFRLTAQPIELEGITSAEWGAPAKRPACSVLENGSLRAAGLDRFPHWKDALARYLAPGGGSDRAA